MIRCASLGSGSAGNALLVEAGATRLLVDCGFGIAEVKRRLARLGRAPEGLSGILITHEHSDHIKGAFALAVRYALPVWATHGTFSASNLPQGIDARVVDSHNLFVLGDLEIQPFPVPHDAREPVQFVFSARGRRLGLLTDAGDITPHIRKCLSGLDALILEFNHDLDMLAGSSYPEFLKRRIAGRLGHLANTAALALLHEIDKSRLQFLVAAHLSESNNCSVHVRRLLEKHFDNSSTHVAIATQKAGFDWQTIS